MSETMTMTLPAVDQPNRHQPRRSERDKPSSGSTNGSSTAIPHCPSCGASLPPSRTATSDDQHAALLDAQRQIEELQAQVRLLNEKATAAADRWADCEDELLRLRAASGNENGGGSNPGANMHTPSPSFSGSSPRSSAFLPAGAAMRISQMLSPRKSVPNFAAAGASARASQSSPALPLPNGALSPLQLQQNTEDLLEALTKEQTLRLAAEARVEDTSKEVEELSAELFEQANEMVATERRARAKLEQYVNVLEQRDEEKKSRLDALHGAMEQIERAREIVEEGRRLSSQSSTQGSTQS